jgi:NADH-quinone oxidoreductase subunit L
MANLTLWVLLLPLLGFVILGVGGRFLPRTAILTVAWGACGLAFLCALISFLSMRGIPFAQADTRVLDQHGFAWLVSGGANGTPQLNIDFGQLLDPLSAVMLLVVTGVGLLIHIYSAGYMDEDPGFWRFFAYLNFFIFAMVLLVIADNFLFLLVGWGLVGLASFLLIGFWYQRRAPVAAARKAFVINVIGDFALMLAIFLLFVSVSNHSLNFLDVFSQVKSINPTTLTIICLLIFVACAAKSAQLPLYMWLPDAMEGPTPVSALIHAATMVTAGVYLVARVHPLFDLAPAALTTMAWIGGITALFGATIALVQLDIKRVLAYSTISQLGYMFLAEGVQGYVPGIFHLVTHAFFKALLFLGAGAVIHALAGEQDMRQMGGLWSRMRITAITFLIGALAISGIPPLAGFWSKDDILAVVLQQASSSGNVGLFVLWGIGILTAGLTAFYMFRLFFNVFTGTYRGGSLAHLHVEEDEAEEPEAAVASHGHGHGGHTGGVHYYDIEEVPFVMWGPLALLAILSVIGGFVGSLSLVGLVKWGPLPHFLEVVFAGSPMPEAAQGLAWISTGASVVVAVLGFAIAWAMYARKSFAYRESRNPLYRLVLNKYYVDEILAALVVNPLQGLSRAFSRFIEGNTLDGGSRGIVWLFRGASNGLRKVQTGYARNYALGIVLGVVLIIVYYAVRG